MRVAFLWGTEFYFCWSYYLPFVFVSFAVHLTNNPQTPYLPECPLAHEGRLSISSTWRNPSRAFSIQRHNLPSASPSPSSGTLLLSAIRSLVSCAPWISSLSYPFLWNSSLAKFPRESAWGLNEHSLILCVWKYLHSTFILNLYLRYVLNTWNHLIFLEFWNYSFYPLLLKAR